MQREAPGVRSEARAVARVPRRALVACIDPDDWRDRRGKAQQAGLTMDWLWQAIAAEPEVPADERTLDQLNLIFSGRGQTLSAIATLWRTANGPAATA